MDRVALLQPNLGSVNTYKSNRDFNKLSIRLLLLFFISACNAWADEGAVVIPQSDTTEKRFVLAPTVGLGMLRAKTSAASLELGVGVRYGFHRRWAAHLSVGQGLKLGFPESLYTRINVMGGFAITGSHVITKSSSSVGNFKQLKNVEPIHGGFYANLGVNQYFFSGSLQTLTFTGLALGGYYQKESYGNGSWAIGAALETGKNGTNTLTVMRLYFSYVLWP